MNEIWKDVIGYEGVYQVSDLGNVKSLSRELRTGTGYRMTKEKILKQSNNINGYLFVGLWEGCIHKNKKIHQLVAESFLNHKPDGTHKLVVDHINDIKTDNRLENLQIITQRENSFKTQGKYSSKYKGVDWNKKAKKWISSITINGKGIYLGSFKKEFDAHVAYQKALEDFNNGKEIKRCIRIESSKYKGVSWNKKANKWVSSITINGKNYHLGSFNCELAAHQAYQNKLKEII